MRFYTGIGNRKAPLWALQAGENIAYHLHREYWVRHGDADGMDTAFSRGSYGNEEVWVPYHNFNRKKRHRDDLKQTVSPLMFNVAGNWLADNHVVSYFWNIEDDFTQKAFTRSLFQLLGQSCGARFENGIYTLNYDMSEFVVYWAEVTQNGNVKGGTRVAVNAAKKLGIPTYNLNVKSQAVQFCERLAIPYRYEGDVLVIL